jgi:hypothetical protein
MLANPAGGPEDILVVAGQLLVTGPVAKVGYRRVVVAGQMLAPQDSQPLLGPALIVKGLLLWYTGQPRFFLGKERFGRSFFELVDQPLTMALVGRFEIDPRGAGGAAAGEGREDHPARQADRAQGAHRGAAAADDREARRDHGGPR